MIAHPGTTALFILASVCLASTACAEPLLDRALVDALNAGDLAGARSALEDGADPNAVLGGLDSEQALCAAMDRSDADALRLLLDYGARVNDIVVHEDGVNSSLACAVNQYNEEAFDLLLELGADAHANLCSKCPSHLADTPMTEAIAGKRYPMALELARSGVVGEAEIDVLVRHLERSPYDAAHPWNAARDGLIAWVRDQGVAISPRPASIDPSGAAPVCVHSPRDLFEGKPPSVCPE